MGNKGIYGLRGHTGLIFWIICILLIFAGLYMLLYRWTSFSPAEHDFHLASTQHPSLIRISHSDEAQSLLLEYSASGNWWLDGESKANETAIKELIRTLRNISVWQIVPLSEQEEMNAYLDQRGIRVEVFEQKYLIRLPFGKGLFPVNKKVLDIEVGKDTQDGHGTYMRMAGAKSLFIVHIPGWPQGVSKVFQIDRQLWRDPAVLPWPWQSMQELRVHWPSSEADSFSLIPHPEGLHELIGRDGDALHPESIDHAKLNRFLQAFSGLHYERIYQENELEMAERMPDTPFISFTFTGPGQEKFQMDCYYRIPVPEDSFGLASSSAYDPNRFFLNINGDTWAIAQFYVFNRVMRPIEFFLAD